jgi:signal peptidase I
MDPRAVAVLRDLAAAGEAKVIVRGACMEPLLHSGDEVTVHARRVYWPGDVIVFRTRAGDLAAHRVLGWRAAGLVTKGDHCEIHDGPVTRANVLGAIGVRVTLAQRACALVQLMTIVMWRFVR